MHIPSGYVELLRAKARLAFEKIFLLQVAQLRSRIFWQRKAMEHDLLCLSSTEVVDRAREVLREQKEIVLTAAQERALKDVLTDMAGPAPMLRLLAGDVGSGKTLVALLAMLACAKDGYQARASGAKEPPLHPPLSR